MIQLLSHLTFPIEKEFTKMQQSQCVKKCGSDRGQGLKSYLENVQMSAESYLTQTKALYTIEYNNTYVQRHSFSAHFHSA